MTEPNVAGVSLKLLVLKSDQLDQLRTFYQSLGITFTPEQHGNGPVHYAGRVGDLTTLEIYPLPDGGTVDRTTRLGFGVANLEEVVENLRAGGSPVTSPPRKTAWGYRAVVEDPDGRAVELYQS